MNHEKRETLSLVAKIASLFMLYMPGMFVLHSYSLWSSYNSYRDLSFTDLTVDCIVMDDYNQLGNIVVWLLIASIVLSVVVFIKKDLVINKPALFAVMSTVIAVAFIAISIWGMDESSGNYHYQMDLRQKEIETSIFYYIEIILLIAVAVLDFMKVYKSKKEEIEEN